MWQVPTPDGIKHVLPLSLELHVQILDVGLAPLERLVQLLYLLPLGLELGTSGYCPPRH